MRRALPALAALVLALLALSGCSLLEAAAVDPPPEDYVSQDAGFRYTRDQLTGQEQYIYDQLLAGKYEDFVAGTYMPYKIPDSYRKQLEDNARMFVAQQEQ